MIFGVDLGEDYHSGRCVDVDAMSPQEAYVKDLACSTGDEIVLQIWDGPSGGKVSRKCVYDFMNGFYEE